MLDFDEALKRILALGEHTALGVETVSLDDAAERVLAEDLVSSADIPSFDGSTMDGYAVSVSDFASDAQSLPVRGESRTGRVPEALEPRTAMRVFTGAPVPAGADAVVMQERVQREGDVATFSAVPRSGQNIRRRGADLVAGAPALLRGTRLSPSRIALVASLDRAELTVTRRPAVAILATGDELRAPGSASVAGTIPESNTVALRAMARRAGATARVHPYVADDREATERAFAAALDDADVVVTIGGVSVGDHDLVRPALAALGVELDFWRVAIKPGKPLAIGRFARKGRSDAIVLGLPGNPTSAIVTFGLFGLPLLRSIQRDSSPLPPTGRAELTHSYRHDRGRLEFARASIAHDGARVLATVLPNQSSGALTTIAAADALVRIPADAEELAIGASVEIVLMKDL